MNEELKLPDLKEVSRFLMVALAALPLMYGEAGAQSAPQGQKIEATDDAKREAILLKPGIIFIPGYRSTLDYWKLVEDKLSATHAIRLFKFPEREGSMANFTLKEIVDAFKADYENFKSQPGVDKDDITIAGFSFGAYIAALSAQDSDAKRIILQALPSYPDGLVDREQPIKQIYETERYWAVRRARDEDKPDSELLKLLGNIKVHVLCISHGNDRITPPSIIMRHCPANQDATITTIPGASHVLSLEEQRQLETIVDTWMRSTGAPLEKK